ncbi:MAG: hypothetical protein KKF98_14070 [Bacteroidetes bacterium]|jgi:hypothetical protein|nr:hypothetical protein [Bacteroidota bacterium]
MKSLIPFLILSLFILVTSCTQNKKQIITEKIQYDVNIESPEPEYDWWIQNLVGPEREKLTNLLIDGVLDGKFQAYDYFNNPLTPEEVRQLFADTLLVTFKEVDPPYELFDSLIIRTIERSDIKRIRFLESWALDPETLEFEKTIYGIAPIARRDDYGDKVMWQPLFWIYTNDQFLSTLKN